MDADGPLDLAAAPVERAEREMSLDGIGVGIHQLQEHVERPVGLLGDEVVEAGQIIGMQFAEGGGPALSPTEVSGEYADDQRRRPPESKSAAIDRSCGPAAFSQASSSIADRLIRTVVDPLAQIFARLEVRYMFAGKRHRLAGLRIAALPRRPKMQREAAESANLDAFSGRQRIAHDLQQLFHGEFHVLRR